MVLLSNFSKLRFLNKSNNNRPKNSTFASGNQFENKKHQNTFKKLTHTGLQEQFLWS